MLFMLLEFIERGVVFSQARQTANALGKPLLNCGCGPWYTPAIMSSDINFDIMPRNVPNFIMGNVENMDMFDNGQFGAVFCSHVLEHVTNLERAKAELARVADYQFIITPSPLSVMSWFNLNHRRVFKDVRGEAVLTGLPPKPWQKEM